MPKLSEVCRHIRSKNAGPFWITVDLFFPDAETFARWQDTPVLQASRMAPLFGASTESVKRFAIPDLHVLKFSYPRQTPQGGVLERDMHGGQQYTRLLDLEL